MSREREMLTQALKALEWYHLLGVAETDVEREIRDYLATAPVDEVYAHYDVHGNRTCDPDRIRSTLLVRKIS